MGGWSEELGVGGISGWLQCPADGSAHVAKVRYCIGSVSMLNKIGECGRGGNILRTGRGAARELCQQMVLH